MIVGMLPSHCGHCEGVVLYRQVNDAPHGQVFCCVNPECIFRNQWQKLPELRTERYYPTPVLLIKKDAA